MLQNSKKQKIGYLGLSMRNWWISPWAQNILGLESSLVLLKIKDDPRREIESSPLEKDSNLEPKEIREEECSQLLVKLYKQQYPTGGQARSKNKFINSIFHELVRPSASISLSLSEFCKTHPLEVNLFPVKIKQLASAGRVKHSVRKW